jgi:hypothetical protein
MKSTSFFVIALAACGTTITQTGINAPPHAMAARPVETVEVFTSAAPSRPHVDVAILEAKQSSEFSADRMPEIITELRKRAAAIGCDGLVINGPNNSVVGDRYNTATLHGYNGTCIVYTEAPPPPPEAPQPPPAGY